MPDELFDWLLKREKTLGFAESCTGGLLSYLVTQNAGVSRFYRGSVNAYHGDLKEDLLGVPKPLMQAVGQVSPPVALAMARGGRDVIHCDFCVSTTGIAGPSGGSVDKPVGTVCFGVVGPGIEYTQTKHFDGGERQQIQKDAAQFALECLWQCIQSR